MIHLTPSFTPSHGFILMEGYQAVTDGQMTFIGGKLVNKTLTAAQAEKIKMLQGIFNRPELITENRTCFAVPFLAPDRRHLQAVLDAIVGQGVITPVLMGCPEPVDEIALGVIFSARQFA